MWEYQKRRNVASYYWYQLALISRLQAVVCFERCRSNIKQFSTSSIWKLKGYSTREIIIIFFSISWSGRKGRLLKMGPALYHGHYRPFENIHEHCVEAGEKKALYAYIFKGVEMEGSRILSKCCISLHYSKKRWPWHKSRGKIDEVVSHPNIECTFRSLHHLARAEYI